MEKLLFRKTNETRSNGKFWIFSVKCWISRLISWNCVLDNRNEQYLTIVCKMSQCYFNSHIFLTHTILILFLIDDVYYYPLPDGILFDATNIHIYIIDSKSFLCFFSFSIACVRKMCRKWYIVIKWHRIQVVIAKSLCLIGNQCNEKNIKIECVHFQ